MKRKILSTLACILILVMAMPTSVLAASNASKLDKLTLKGVKAYDTPLPKKGVKKKKKQIDALLSKIPNKTAGKGNTYYSYSLYFEKNTSANAGEYYYACKEKSWNKYDSKKKRSSYYGESIDLINADTGVSCNLMIEDSKYYNSYYWIKGEKEGGFSNYKKTSGGSAVKFKNYKLYPDKKVLGQKCLVYSYDQKNGSYKSTTYEFISRKTGQLLKYINVDSGSIFTSITFDAKLMKKSASFYSKPKNVKFTEYQSE